ncbi:Uncharacterised protein [Vibrio cholerae]|nr:Uncharacterised protein [Vibrio cholerae]CSI35034.1 Uncharacterised protein [Vibrio cholerae]
MAVGIGAVQIATATTKHDACAINTRIKPNRSHRIRITQHLIEVLLANVDTNQGALFDVVKPRLLDVRAADTICITQPRAIHHLFSHFNQ